MAHKQEILELLNVWKKKKFRKTDLSLSDAVASLNTDDPVVAVRPGLTASKWVIYNNTTNNVATLVHVLLWAWSYDLQTGNYVPENETAPDGIPEERIQRDISYKCEFIYAFDTTIDTSIHDLILDLEDNICEQPEFNKANRERRKWQDGRSEISRQKYLAACRLFARRSPMNNNEKAALEAPYDIHPWIVNGLREDKRFIPNPQRPAYLEYSQGKMTALQDTNRPNFMRGDIVLVSFMLGFTVARDCWYPEMIPLEIIRVGELPSDFTTHSDYASWPSDPNFNQLMSGDILFPIEDPVPITGKRTKNLGPPNNEESELSEMEEDHNVEEGDEKLRRIRKKIDRSQENEYDMMDLEEDDVGTEKATTPSSRKRNGKNKGKNH